MENVKIPKPFELLAELVTNHQRVETLVGLAKELELPLPTGLIQLAYLKAGLNVPLGNTAGELVPATIATGIPVWPASLYLPKPGDVFVISNEQRRPSQVGLVGKIDVAGNFFNVVNGNGRLREECLRIDYWIGTG